MEITIDILILIGAFLLLILGFIGGIVPALPGPILSFAALLVGHYFVRFMHFSSTTLWIVGCLAIFIQLLDQVVPVLGTKRFGGTKYGTWGSIIGLIAGLLFPLAIGPFGIITIMAGPFIGAYVGEKMGGQDNQQAFKAAFGSFLGFLAGTVMKLLLAGLITIIFIIGLIKGLIS